ncbi:MAG: CtsR family transcriptional regulator [Clostridia bacterium]|nr:CtsR family transcriptional regulator [Clostridia bacterium]
MLISEKIARMIEQMLEEQNGIAEIQRNDFAGKVGCVPSQINYVLASRFSKQHGYIVESRRGGGGYIKITRMRMDKSSYLMHLFASAGESLDRATLAAFLDSMVENAIIDARTAKMFLSLTSDDTLSAAGSREIRDALRADLFKTFVVNLL